MMYLPLIGARYFRPDPSAPNAPTVFRHGVGFISSQQTFRPVEELLAKTIEKAIDELSGAEPMESRVMAALKSGRKYSKSDLEHPVYRWSSLAPDCTLQTALRRLEKKGLIAKQLVSQGYYRKYVYFITKIKTD